MKRGDELVGAAWRERDEGHGGRKEAEEEGQKVTARAEEEMERLEWP